MLPSSTSPLTSWRSRASPSPSGASGRAPRTSCAAAGAEPRWWCRRESRPPPAPAAGAGGTPSSSRSSGTAASPATCRRRGPFATSSSSSWHAFRSRPCTGKAPGGTTGAMAILDDIVRDKREEVRRRRISTPVAALQARCRERPPGRELDEALRPSPGRVRLIAEVKKASPSRGVLAATLDPVATARTYAEHGANAISVLTDEKYFQGRLEDLEAIRRAVSVPLLRKDFTIDEYQLWEARAAGADAVLLIVAILDAAQLQDLLQATKGLGLSALVECHTAPEVEAALAAGTRIIGLNNRDLRTFTTRLETTLELLPLIPPGPIVVSESGFFTAADVSRVAQAGAHAVLVGEGLVTATDVAAKIKELTLMGAGTGGAVGGSSHPGRAGGEMGGASRPTHS